MSTRALPSCLALLILLAPWGCGGPGGCGQSRIARGTAMPKANAHEVRAPGRSPTLPAMNTKDPRLPGISTIDDALDASLKAISRERRRGDPPRTRHRDPDGEPRFVNRLAREASPYLLQHAHNPVNWFPWGEAAFARARALDRPIFLSVGYSTCHWCHVMEEESFEDPEIAAYLNTHFVAIKVDREERPDVDATYMSAVHALRGQGGWPMTVILTPDGEPFFAATYLPPRAGVRGAQVGLDTILARLADDYAAHPEKVMETAKEVTAHLVQASSPHPPAELPTAESVRAAAAGVSSTYDATHGGFGHAPKFPRPVTLELLLRVARRTGDTTLREEALHTLEAMADGGLNDQLGGGFHRYSTDARFRVPHFEKMLYDNAQLARVYLEAWQLTGEARHRETVEQTLDYLLREMQAPEGCFYAATDADSLDPDGELEEGAFFTWTPDELRAQLSGPDAMLAARAFGVTERGDLDGRTVLHRSEGEAELAKSASLSLAGVHERLQAIRSTLLAARAKRPPPHRDEKILVAWNGLAISAFSRAGFALDREDYLVAARRCADRLLGTLRLKGTLHHSMTAGLLSGPGFLDDHTFLAEGLLDLFEASGDLRFLDEARATMAALDDGFRDAKRGGYFQTGRRHETLITREKPDYDGAIPSGNSVAAHVHLRLATLGDDSAQRARADGILRAQSALITRAGPAVPLLVTALERRLEPALEVVLIQPQDDPGAPLLSVLRRTYLPNASLLLLPEAEVKARSETLPLLAGKTARHGRATTYVCREGLCKLPTSDPAILEQQLAEVQGSGSVQQ